MPGVTYTERAVTPKGWTHGTPAPGSGICRVHMGVGVFCQPRFLAISNTFTERTCVSTSFTERTVPLTAYTERSV